MSQFENFFSKIQDEIEKDLQQKSALQELEHQLDLKLIPHKNFINELSALNPQDLITIPTLTSPEIPIPEILDEFTTSLGKLDCKAVQKERLLNKSIEECAVLILAYRYYRSIGECFNTDGETVKVPMVSNSHLVGTIGTPRELSHLLNLEKIDYQVYLLALLRVVDTIVDYTSSTVIRLSIGSNSPKDYTIAMINSEIVSKLQKGYQLLDLKNDILRKKYDGLKYNSQRLNKIVYDLSLRNLISCKGEVV
ncbi:uncharacterized protein SPAPADRAFT_62478 [Spathaspora passalidarum NRRL Y-27907]|uniref:Translin n=1 Tax=Spathaspora passalidarum (strain NRRL Y-27907 / 11-Y1) TaxID=619300 RepID=G3AS19_SPAPN|nr:uncharacterized protein SPAPADRAFT_62478 [Spathaspora passalidarum NRRL Y-27907]EGW31868.1 hypothetical protein SPAPADRAFT_62478 [Spathaspora passalidarum NRRL Y-27907]